MVCDGQVMLTYVYAPRGTSVPEPGALALSADARHGDGRLVLDGLPALPIARTFGSARPVFFGPVAMVRRHGCG